MGKKRSAKEIVKEKKKIKSDADSLLSSGVFGSQLKGSSSGDWENEEQDYELVPRTISKTEDSIEQLPIKTSDGKLKRVVVKHGNNEEKDLNGQDTEDDENADSHQEDEENIEADSGEFSEDEDSSLSSAERLNKIKEEIADLSTKLIEDPEENITCLTRLRKMSESKNFVTSSLAMMALIPVLKSIAPSYKIRPLSEIEKKQKVSKDVAKTRQYEQSLLFNYGLYVDHLSSMAKVSVSNSQNNKKISMEQIKKGQLAAKAACELCLSSLRHFNYRNELISILCRRLNRKPSNQEDLEIFMRCIRLLETLLQEDESRGDISFDIVKILTKSIKEKKFRVDESVLNILLSLSLLKDYDPGNKEDGVKEKTRKKDRIHLSKKQRKARKATMEIEEEMRKAELVITAEEREKYQAQVLKMILTLYIEILKASTQGDTSSNANASNLMAAVLEGLAKFGSMANLDLLGDFLEVLREILSNMIKERSLDKSQADISIGGVYDGSSVRIVLLCIATAFTLITSFSSVGKLPISIDLSNFVSSLYALLADISLDCDLEFSHKTLRLADPLSMSSSAEKPSVNVSTKSELLLRCLDSIFFRSKNFTVPRATAFTKRLYVCMLNTPEKTTLACLKFVSKLMNRYGESISGLWSTEDQIHGDGKYILGIERADREVELEACHSEDASLWENALLEMHYSPHVRENARQLFKNSTSTR
ncbi:Piso0_000275 [Millerozyma farinosa CBS 7064]|uniref:Nucleolar complex-associated protein 3 n=1 Tax=Pichia sorbitophila (strain ATCC MYA-4447 / BCRC 22081 / CBS 7064 / NBRC 10061 / NRRL Y-12695) TaxID=559304 RepID=G8YV01_PICSO|nr:Piso0_000275 [Millerozyma farinosa CBS 7064]